MRRLAALSLFVVTAVAGSAQEAVGYDEYARLPRQEQVRVFNEITPEAKAAIVQTHVNRWLAVNRARLSAEQVVAVEEMVSWIRPELYDDVDREAEQTQAMKRAERLLEVLPREDVRRAFGEPGAPGNYIPPPNEE